MTTPIITATVFLAESVNGFFLVAETIGLMMSSRNTADSAFITEAIELKHTHTKCFHRKSA